MFHPCVRRAYPYPKGRRIIGATYVQLSDTISFDSKTVALPAAALLFVLVLLITAITGGAPG